jgi:hypothetical protein
MGDPLYYGACKHAPDFTGPTENDHAAISEIPGARKTANIEYRTRNRRIMKSEQRSEAESDFMIGYWLLDIRRFTVASEVPKRTKKGMSGQGPTYIFFGPAIAVSSRSTISRSG